MNNIFYNDIYLSVKEKTNRTELLIQMIIKKTNQDYDAFCEALHETKQTHIVHNLLVTDSK